MDEEKIKLAMEVGKASQEAILAASRLVKPGARLIDVAEAAEKQLMASGFGLAFPLNLSQNERAAHSSPSFEDAAVCSNKDIVKIDFGAEKDGMLGDGALTVDLSGNHGKMIEAAELALELADFRRTFFKRPPGQLRGSAPHREFRVIGIGDSSGWHVHNRPATQARMNFHW